MSHIKSRDESETVYFETYTAHERMRGFDNSVINLRQGWKKIVQLKRDRYPSMSHWFIKVFEAHRDGTLHLHVLSNLTVGEYFVLETDSGKSQWVANLNDIARTRGLGYMAKSIRLNSRYAAAKYVTKYMIKGAHSHGFPKHFRRIEFSRNIPKLSDKRGGGAASEMQWRAWYQENHRAIIAAIVDDTMQVGKVVRVMGQLANVQAVGDLLGIDATWDLIPLRHFFRAALASEQ